MHDFPFGYCTNVHAGTSFLEAKSNLQKYAVRVREKLEGDGRLPVGLWLSQQAAEDLKGDEVAAFGSWLAENSLVPYTFNGFPQQDFHQPIVKHDVYKPTWLEESRRDYTIKLCYILADLLDEGQVGSISTLPLGWPANFPNKSWSAEQFEAAAVNLHAVARCLAEIQQNRDIEIVLAIEPEPGCVLNTGPEMIDFFSQYLFRGPDEEAAKRHLTICHDMCHSAVMWEAQRDVLESYLHAGIRVGKVQVSSAVHVPWDRCREEQDFAKMRKQLEGFNEPKYLHQVTSSERESSRADSLQLAAIEEDLPKALSQWQTAPSLPWRVHFHVPLFVDEFGVLATTQGDIPQATEYLEQNRQHQVPGGAWFTGHYEVETYAWPVLPAHMAEADLAEGIANELRYFESVWSACQGDQPQP